MELQAPREFISAYMWIFLGVGIGAALLSGIVIFWPSAPAVQHSCYTTAGLTCSSAALAAYSQGSVFLASFRDSINAKVAMYGDPLTVYPYQNSSVNYTGNCFPQIVTGGQSFLCTVYMRGYAPQSGILADPRFNLNYTICGSVCTSNKTGYTISGSSLLTTGLPLPEAENLTQVS